MSKYLFKLIMIIFFLILLFTVLLLYTANKNYYKGQVTDHFDGTKFYNFKKNSLKTDDKVLLNYF